MAALIAALMMMMMMTSVPAQADARTWHDVIREHLAFDRTYVIDAYKEHGRRDGKWDKAVEQLLEAQTYAMVVAEKHVIYQSNKSPVRADQRAALAHKVVDSGCDDPMALYMSALALDDNRERSAAVGLFRRANEGFVDSQYTAVYQLRAIQDDLDRRNDLRENAADIEAVGQRFRPTFQSVLESKEYFPAFRQVVWDKLLFLFDDSDEKRLLRVGAEMEDVSDPDPWLFHTYMGHVEIKRGWNARGYGWADDVSPEGWKAFADHLAKARVHLEKAAAADDRLPHPYTFLVTVGMGESGDQKMRKAFDAAVARQPDFTAAYLKLLSGLQPRWGGDYNQMLDVGVQAAKNTDYTTRTPAMLLEAISSIESDRQRAFGSDELERYYALVEPMLDGYISHAASEPVLRWAYTQKMIWNFRLQRWEAARTAYDAIEGDYIQKTLGEADLDTFDTMGQMFAMTCSAKDEVAAALEETTASVRVQLLQAVLGKLETKDRARPWLERKLRSAEFGTQVALGEWVDFPIAKDLKNWRVDRGNWEVDEHGALVGRPRRGISIVSNVELPKQFEFRCEVENIDRQGDAPRRVYVFPAWRREQEVGMYIDLDARHMIVVINRQSVATVPLAVNGSTATVHIAFDGKKLQCLTDGSVTQVVKLPGLLDRPRRLVLGGFSGQVGTSWRFSGMQLRAYQEE